RSDSLVIQTDSLVMTGIREEKQKGPLQGKDTKVNPVRETDKEKKLELPFKPGANADPAQMKQASHGGIEPDTTANKILGDLPSMTTPDAAKKPSEGTAKPPIQEKAGEKKTPDKVLKDAQKTPVKP
ncbi:hypothetical protein JW906_08625, partial [bacterium]|nr:hypothetical protein [bacterium]